MFGFLDNVRYYLRNLSFNDEKPVVGAGLVVYRRMAWNYQYLLLKAAEDKHWAPPKGMIKGDETEFASAVRGTEEESGLKPEDFAITPNYKTTIHYRTQGQYRVMTFWLAEIKDPAHAIKISREHTDYRWLNIEEALKVVKYPETQRALRDCQAFLTQERKE